MQQPWKQRGIVHLWKYTENSRNYPGWNLSADDQGAASLLELFQAMLDGHEGSQYRTVAVTPPTRLVLSIPNNGSARWIAPRAWRVQLLADPTDKATWCLIEQEGLVELKLGPDMMVRLVEGIVDIQNGNGDYSIGSGHNADTSLWFWWWPV